MCATCTCRAVGRKPQLPSAKGWAMRGFIRFKGASDSISGGSAARRWARFRRGLVERHSPTRLVRVRMSGPGGPARRRQCPAGVGQQPCEESVNGWHG